MSAESDLVAILSPLVAGRVYPELGTRAGGVPYITFQQVGGQPLSFLERALPSKKNGRFQFNCWDKTREGAAALQLQVESTLVLTEVLQINPLSEPIATFDEEARLQGTFQDFTVWSER